METILLILSFLLVLSVSIFLFHKNLKLFKEIKKEVNSKSEPAEVFIGKASNAIIDRANVLDNLVFLGIVIFSISFVLIVFLLTKFILIEKIFS